MGGREIKAFMIAPLPMVVPLLLAIEINLLIEDTDNAEAAATFLAMVAFTLLSYGATFLIGIPIHLVLRHYRKAGLINYLGLTVLPFVLLAGAIAAWLRLAPAPIPPVNPFGLYMQGGNVIKWTLVFAAIAMLPATTFWYTGVRQPRS